MAEKVLKNAIVKTGSDIEVLSPVIGGAVDKHSKIINATLVLSGVTGSNFNAEVRTGTSPNFLF